MTKRSLLILSLLTGTAFWLVSFIMPQLSGSLENTRQANVLEQPSDLKLVKNNHGREEKDESFPDGEPQQTYEWPIGTTVADIESELENEQALEHLNANTIDTNERLTIGRKLQNLDHLRAQELERQLEAIEKDVAELALTLSLRLKTYGASKP